MALSDWIEFIAGGGNASPVMPGPSHPDGVLWLDTRHTPPVLRRKIGSDGWEDVSAGLSGTHPPQVSYALPVNSLYFQYGPSVTPAAGLGYGTWALAGVGRLPLLANPPSQPLLECQIWKRTA